jgi:hypothetical protein
MEEQNLPEKKTDRKQRSLGLSIVLIFSFVYNGLLLVAMIFGLFSVDIIQDILKQYYNNLDIPDSKAFLITLSGTIIFGLSFFGLILLWLMRRKGFYFYAIAQIIMLASIVFIFKSFDLVNISIAIAVLIIIGLHTKAMR